MCKQENKSYWYWHILLYTTKQWHGCNTSTSSCHAKTLCEENHTIRISYNPHLLFVMDTYGPLDTVEQGFLYLHLFCLLESPRRNHYQNSCRLSDPYIYLYILSHIYLYILCQILSFSEYIQKCFQDLLLAKHSSRLPVILF